jgi:hypothetical protein
MADPKAELTAGQKACQTDKMSVLPKAVQRAGSRVAQMVASKVLQTVDRLVH